MKKIVIVLIAAMACFFSCESNEQFLKEDPKGQLFSDNFMNNLQELELMNMGLYNLFARSDGPFDRPYESFEIKYASSDDIIGTGNQRACFLDIEVNLEFTSRSNDDIQLAWERTYNCINQANVIINNYRNAEDAMPEAELNKWGAQAHFIRAFTYFWLVRFFNNIPLVLDAYTPDEKREMTCSSSKDVYEVIISDLQFAEQWLPVKWTGPMMKGGAVTKGAAKSLLAKVYLQMAGFPVNGGTEYYVKARDKAKEVIDQADEHGYGLYDHFWQLWDANWSAHERPVEEVIIWMAHTTSHYTVRTPNCSRPNELGFGGWEMMVAELGFYNRFPEGERKEFTFITDFYHSNGSHYHFTELRCAHPCYRKWWADNLTTGWEWDKRDEPDSKWRSGMNLTSTWFNSRSIIVMRYADVLLTYAEAKARTDGLDELAYKCLNDVRNRAFKGLGTTEASVSGLSTADFIDLVVWERAWEFAGMEYSARWFDLQRLELVEKANTEWREEPEEKYRLARPYIKKDYFLPIPSKETVLNPNLKNNNPEFN